MTNTTPTLPAQRDSQNALTQHFTALGAEHLDLPFLYRSDELLNLYGEDLRGRAFLYGDAERGDELCLRPDFTVPVAMAHRDKGWDRKAIYTYSGTVFRLQPWDMDRPVEYVQAGIERFGDTDTALTDAQVFLALRTGVHLLGVDALEATIGDLSIVLAVLDALHISPHHRVALKRHLWRPTRFQALLKRAVTAVEPSNVRRNLVAADASGRRAAARGAGEEVGKRSVGEVLDRLNALQVEASALPMKSRDADLISEVFRVRCPCTEATGHIAELTRSAGIDISATLRRFDARLQHLLDAGCDAQELQFDAAFGRSLEYYDGFVFEIRKAGAAEHPPLAGGGRYDAMTVRLGASRAVPAVGGIVRPEAVSDCLS